MTNGADKDEQPKGISRTVVQLFFFNSIDSTSTITPHTRRITHCKHNQGTKKHQIGRPAPAAHTNCLSLPAAAALHVKKQGFVPRLPPKTKLMQHPCSHSKVFCNIMSQTTWQYNIATFMQPLHRDLQPEIQQAQRTPHTTLHCSVLSCHVKPHTTLH